MEPVDTAALVHDVIAELAPVLQRTGAVVAVGELPVLAAHPALLRQVFGNLIGNAVKYVPEGGDVVVTVEAAEAAARLAVRDEGPGVPAEHLPRLFERFYRADATGADVLGRGLDISRINARPTRGRSWPSPMREKDAPSPSQSRGLRRRARSRSIAR